MPRIAPTLAPLALVLTLGAPSTLQAAPLTAAASSHNTSPPSAKHQTVAMRDSALRRFLESRHGEVTMAFVDLANGTVEVYHPHVRQVCASMAKIDILAALLSSRGAKGLSKVEQRLATSMIEFSDNAAAQLLWNDLGGFGLSSNPYGTGGTLVARRFNAALGFNETPLR